MKSLILLGLISIAFAAQSLDLTKYCGCSDYKISTNCTGSCMWANNACRTKVCSDYAETECKTMTTACKWDFACTDYTVACADFTTESTCDSLSSKYNCAWNKTVCAAFTKCADYIPGGSQCSSKSSSTQACQNNTANTACENSTTTAPTTCAGITASTQCFYAGNTNCIWDTTCKDLTACTQLTTQPTCQNYSSSCVWATTTTCTAKTCADNTTPETCTYVKGGISATTGTLCKWDTTTKKCADAADTSALTSANCRTNTAATYVWDGTKCNQCSGFNKDFHPFDLIRASFNGSVVLGMIVSLWMIQF